jgi:RNA polymerase sigma-70 factor, ECF subfamily
MSVNPESWVSDHGTIMYRYALARCSRADVAENLVQEAFVGALRAKDSFSGKSSERTWLMGILKHKLMDYYRTKSRERPVEDIDAMAEDVTELFERNGKWKQGPIDWGQAPEQALSNSEFREVLTDCLSHLPGRQAAVFSMREVDGRETAEICKELDVTETNLWVMMHRARARLRRCLEVNWFGLHSEEPS